MPTAFVRVKSKGESVTPVWHPWNKWECYRAGFFDRKPKFCSKEEGEEIYTEFLSSSGKFELGLQNVLKHWKYSCSQNLSKENTNRIAWLGQASVCIERGIPSVLF